MEDIIPDEILHKILGYLNDTVLFIACHVNKRWEIWSKDIKRKRLDYLESIIHFREYPKRISDPYYRVQICQCRNCSGNIIFGRYTNVAFQAINYNNNELFEWILNKNRRLVNHFPIKKRVLRLDRPGFLAKMIDVLYYGEYVDFNEHMYESLIWIIIEDAFECFKYMLKKHTHYCNREVMFNFIISYKRLNMMKYLKENDILWREDMYLYLILNHDMDNKSYEIFKYMMDHSHLIKFNWRGPDRYYQYLRPEDQPISYKYRNIISGGIIMIPIVTLSIISIINKKKK